MKVRVCMSAGERARVLVDGCEVDAIVRGEYPVTGDWVTARWVEPELVLIEEIEERLSKIARRSAGRSGAEQVLAANVDIAFIVCGLDGDFNVRRIERYLAIAYEGRVRPVVVLNKADLGDAPEVPAPEVLIVSALTGQGVDAVDAMLTPGVTAVLLGSSGAGKSTLLNRLIAGERQKTGAVRESDSRGRHTTTSRELILLPNGAAVIDSPGIREIQLLVSEDAIDAVFDEIAALAQHCHFGDCSHNAEPGCEVRDAVPPDRLESFHKLQREAERLSGERTEKQRWRTIHKANKRFYKERGH
ncbi:MAG: ribosome small subunit-dependent GTPase A [Bryobacteraceae bacterium]